MDISLERIMSLLPKKPDGKIVHGAKKKFCEEIGAPPNIFSEWERGVNHSYRNYLYQISAIKRVSVEWLKGETDDPTPKEKKISSPQIGELTEDELKLLMAYRAASEKKRASLLGLLED